MTLKTKYNYNANGAVKNIHISHKILTESFEIFENECETAVILLSGSIEFNFDKTYVLSRKNVFEEKASAIYIPKNTKILIVPKNQCELAICKTKVDKNSTFAVILPENIKEEIRGKVGFRRKVFDILDEHSASIKLVVGETINFKGEWSSFPPHKHDEESNEETKMEEIYLFKLNPENGFGLQRIYTKDKSLDEAIVIEHNDIVLIPKGYHPLCVIPGYELYYLWVLVGKTKKLMPNTQEEYKWLMK